MTDKKLILFSYDFPPGDGGIARLCQEIAAGAASRYNEVIVLTRKKSGISIPYNTGGISIIELPAKRIRCEFSALKYLYFLKDKRQYDLICGLWHPEAMLAILAGFKNVVTLAHGTELLYGASGFRKRFWLPVYAKYVLKKSALVVANSSYTAGLVKGISRDAAVVSLPLAVNQLYFKPLAIDKNKQKLTLCSVSRIQQFKGHDFVLEVIAGLPLSYRAKIQYNIAGTGSYLPALKALAVKLGLESQVQFFGFVPDKDLPVFYNMADIFILCTRESNESTQVEGFGLVFLEAQACGIPVIGTNTGGIADAVKNNKGGWLIEQDNKAELTALLISMIDNSEIAKEAGVVARLRIEDEATWEKYCFKLFNLLEKI